MILTSPIETERLILRTLGAADITPAYLSWLTDPQVTWALEIRFAPAPTLEGLGEFVDGMNASPDNLMTGIFLRQSGRHIGNVKLGPIVRPHARADIGFLIGARDCWGKGYASEAIAALARYGLEKLRLEKVTAGCYENNLGSAKALLKAGFVQEAVIPSSVIVGGRRVGSIYFGLDKPGS